MLLALIIFMFCSCATNKNIKENKRNIEILKEFAYCKCMEQSIKTFSKVDTSEVGSGEIRIEMDYYGLFENIVNPIFDSIAYTVVKRQMASKYDSIGKHESAWGRTSYILGCLSFYKSKQLDSVVKSIPKEFYIVNDVK